MGGIHRAGDTRTWSLRVAEASAKVRADLSLPVLDAAIVAAAYLAVLVLRFDGSVPSVWWRGFASFVPVAVLLHFLANLTWGLYGRIWRHASIHEARRLLAAGGTAGTVLSVIYLSGTRQVPASVVVLGALLATGLLGGLRFQSRLLAFQRGAARERGKRVVVIGGGQAGAALVHEMRSQPTLGMRPVAVIDDTHRNIGRLLGGVPIVGGLEALPVAAMRHGAELAILAMPTADSATVTAVANAADAVGLSLKVLPSVAELLGGEVSLRDVRDVSIADLLGRQQVSTDLAAVRAMLRGRSVVVTGAGGSIGSELARQIAVCEPETLVLLDHDETHLHDAAASIPEGCEQVLADVRSARDLRRVFQRYRPSVVFHAAAHKHVPILERHPVAAAHTNVVGTANVIAVSQEFAVERFVLISTDKAVRPSSVMGASKRAGELLVTSLAPPGAGWCAVRFGNVLGSRGSVIPTFVRQIQEGGPVTVTDPRMTRFFMSIEEAVQLVLQAAVFSAGGEIFMLDMGQPVRIMDLAERMIRLSGRRVGHDIGIQITGLRPGEKLVEELQSVDEVAEPTSHPSIVALRGVGSVDGLDETLRALRRCVEAGDDAEAARLLFELSEAEVVHAPAATSDARAVDRR